MSELLGLTGDAFLAGKMCGRLNARMGAHISACIIALRPPLEHMFLKQKPHLRMEGKLELLVDRNMPQPHVIKVGFDDSTVAWRHRPGCSVPCSRGGTRE
jgi:hypothetical protein